MLRNLSILALAALLASCGGTPRPDNSAISKALPNPTGGQALVLRDSVVYSQKDPLWASDRLGKTTDTMGAEGCLVTATSMALTNLGFKTNPKDLNARLTATDSYTDRGWLIWDGIRRVTNGRAVATYYDEVNAETVDQCMRSGEYPMVQFNLPNGRSHWSMIVRHDERGYHMRDPLRISKKPLLFPAGIEGYRALRCVGLAKG